MSRFWLRAASIAFFSTLLGCTGATEPLGTEVDFARNLWLAHRPRAYSFEVAPSSAWFAPTGYYRVTVSDGQVVSASDPSGKPLTDFTLTVDGIWDELLAARERNELNSVRFQSLGVPAEVDWGEWAVDGGVHYSVRNFARTR